MIKELIFNNQKYWQNDEKPTPNWVGKSLKLPKDEIKLNQYQKDAEDDNAAKSGGISFWLQESDYVLHRSDTNKVVGQVIDYKGNTFVWIYGTTNENGRSIWLKMSDILQNGGVSSSPLTHLYQGLRHLLNRKVAPV